MRRLFIIFPFLLIIVGTLMAGGGTAAAILLSRPGLKSNIQADIDWYLDLRKIIMGNAAKVAWKNPRAAEIKMIHSWQKQSCDLPPFFVVKVMDKLGRPVGFMLWGLDSTAGQRVWRLIIYEDTVEAFNEYAGQTPFFEAVVKDMNKTIVSVC